MESLFQGVEPYGKQKLVEDGTESRVEIELRSRANRRRDTFRVNA